MFSLCTSASSTSEKTHKPTAPGWFPRWTPTSDYELFEAETAILNPIRPMISQRMIAGLNTICTVHEKVGDNGKPISQPYRAIPNEQTIHLQPLKKDSYTSIVCVHGFGGGLANYIPIWKTLAEKHDVYAFDLPGFARSERTKGVKLDSPQSALDWFMERFHAWFTEMGLGLDLPDCPAAPSNTDEDSNRNRSGARKRNRHKEGIRPSGRKVVLMGHSFGGYLCAMFAARYPNLIDHAILADPWGMAKYVPPDKEKDPQGYAFRKSFKFTFGYWVFNNIGAGGVLGLTGPWGKGLLPKLRPDFGEAWAAHLDDPQHFYDYTYHCNANGHRVGERAFSKLGPIETFLCLLDHTKHFPPAATSTINKTEAAREVPDAAQELEAAIEDSSPEVRLSRISLLYGAHSWMYARAKNDAPVFVDTINKETSVHAVMIIIPGAGHQLISDEPTRVAATVLSLVS